jgi:hypothetical protein
VEWTGFRSKTTKSNENKRKRNSFIHAGTPRWVLPHKKLAS